MQRGFAAVVSLIFLSGFFFGCASTRVLTPTESYLCGRYDDAYKSFEGDVKTANPEEDGDYVLKNYYLASAALMSGDYDTLEESARSAMKVAKSNLGETEGMASMAVRESIRIYKGEPYEKAMAGYYAGLSAYYKGDYEAAVVYLKNSLLFDKGSEEGHRDDFAATLYLLAKCYQKLGMTDEYLILTDKVAKLSPGAAEMLRNSAKNNILVFVELGQIGQKRPDRYVAAYDEFYPIPSIENHCILYANDKEIGTSADLLDLNHQGETRGVAAGKAASQTAKGAASFAAGLIPVVGNLAKATVHATIAAQDFRQWFLLPKKIAVFEGRLEPGHHTLVVKFFGAGAQELKRFEQVHYYIPIIEGKETVLYLRGSENRHNAYTAKKTESGIKDKLDIPFQCNTYPADPQASFDKFMLSTIMTWNPSSDTPGQFVDRD